MASEMPKKLGDFPKVMHTVRPSGNAGSIINRSPNTTSRNTGIGLPKVSGGMPAHPSHINDLSAAVQKTTVRTAVGGFVRQSNGGTTVELPRSKGSHPFKVTLVGDRVMMSSGLVFSYGSMTCGIQQYFASATIDYPIPRGGEFLLPAGSKASFADVDVTSSADANATNFTFPAEDLTNGRMIWMDAETNPPTLRNTTLSEYRAASAIPIAYLRTDTVIQLVKENITIRQVMPLQASISAEMVGSTRKYYLKVTGGTVNSVAPTLGGASILLPETKLEVPATSASVWLKCNRSETASFPTSVEVLGYGLNDIPPDTNSAGYIRLASLLFTPDGSSGYAANYLSGSLSAEAHKFSPSTTQYYYYRV